MSQTAQVVICGAGIAGAAAAYFLTVRHGVTDVLLVDSGPPLSLTSDKSSEGYRNWWPGPGTTMVDFSNRSIDLMEELDLAFPGRIAMNRRGYVFATSDQRTLDQLAAQARDVATRGAGAFRSHESLASSNYEAHTASGWQNKPTGVDVLRGADLVQRHFPALSDQTVGLVHARRCGWISAQQLGALLLEQARAAGARIVTGELSGVDTSGGKVRGVTITGTDGACTVSTPQLLLCPGPYLQRAAHLLDVELPVVCEGHVKVALRDVHSAMPADAPLVCWMDPVELPWSNDERDALGEEPALAHLLKPFPAGVHGRPSGQPGHHYALMLWTYHIEPSEPVFPLEWDPHLPEVIVRGMSTMLPGMSRYFDPLPRMTIDGGYYCKTPENRPLVGPLPVEGAFVSAAYSGYGIMTSCAGGELAAAHLTQSPLPDYAAALLPSRFDDPAYLDGFADAAQAGQL